MNKFQSLAWPIAAALIALTGCTQSRVVLLPDASGKVGHVEVSTDDAKRTLTRPYQTTVTDRFGTSDDVLSADQVRDRFGKLIDHLPRPPQRYVLYFEPSSDTLTEESKQQFVNIRAALPHFPSAEVIVTGHTDRVGPLATNDALSIKRAEQVRELLVAEGLKREMIMVAGRGEREPAVPTDDEVEESRNRRVEVKIR